MELQVFSPAIVRVFFPAFAVIFACVWRVFLPAIPVFLPVSCVSCMYFCLQKQAILHASRGQICMSSACKTTCTMPVVFRELYMRPQAIRVCSARGACRLEAGKFTCIYR